MPQPDRLRLLTPAQTSERAAHALSGAVGALASIREEIRRAQEGVRTCKDLLREIDRALVRFNRLS